VKQQVSPVSPNEGFVKFRRVEERSSKKPAACEDLVSKQGLGRSGEKAAEGRKSEVQYGRAQGREKHSFGGDWN